MTLGKSGAVSAARVEAQRLEQLEAWARLPEVNAPPWLSDAYAKAARVLRAAVKEAEPER